MKLRTRHNRAVNFRETPGVADEIRRGRVIPTLMFSDYTPISRRCGPRRQRGNYLPGNTRLLRCLGPQRQVARMRSSVELEEEWGLGYVKQREQERAAAAQRALGPDPAGYPSRTAGTD